MALKYQCNIDLQDCPILYPEGLTGTYQFGTSDVKFTHESCVRDQRLEGNVSRCGFPGAPCIVNETVSNCASGASFKFMLYSVWPRRPIMILSMFKAKRRYVSKVFVKGSWL